MFLYQKSGILVLGGDDMNTRRELNYRMYVQRMDGFSRLPIRNEFEHYTTVRMRNIEKVRSEFEKSRPHFQNDKGTLSDDPVANVRYHLIVAVAVIARLCAEDGFSQNEAYTLSDIYIRRADRCRNYDAMLDLFLEMMLDYAEHMQELRKQNVISLHIRRCIDYIYEHLHEDLSVPVLSEVVGLNPTYLSKLFAKETGTTIKKFVTGAKIGTAENLLKYSDYTYTEIAFALGFSSHSAFIGTFKKLNGITPRQYREQYASQLI